MSFLCFQPGYAGEWKYHTEFEKQEKTKMNSLETKISGFVVKKRTVKDPEKLKIVLDQIRTGYGELKTHATDYNENLTHMRYRHPAKGDETNRKYSLYKMRTLQDMENAVGIDGQLDRVKRKMVKVYSPDLSPPKPMAAEAVAEKKDPDEGRVRLSK